MEKCCRAHLDFVVDWLTSSGENISVKVTPLEYTRGADQDLKCESCGAPAVYIVS